MHTQTINVSVSDIYTAKPLRKLNNERLIKLMKFKKKKINLNVGASDMVTTLKTVKLCFNAVTLCIINTF